jgi:hypothetical protein
MDRVEIRGQARVISIFASASGYGAVRASTVSSCQPGTDDLCSVTILEIDHEFRLVGRLDARRAGRRVGS